MKPSKSFKAHEYLPGFPKSTYHPVEVLNPRDLEGIVRRLWGNVGELLLDASRRMLFM